MQSDEVLVLENNVAHDSHEVNKRHYLNEETPYMMFLIKDLERLSLYDIPKFNCSHKVKREHGSKGTSSLHPLN